MIMLSLSWLYSTPSHFLEVDYQRLGHDFRADNGFVPQVGIERKAATSGYRFYPAGWLRFVQPGVPIRKNPSKCEFIPRCSGYTGRFFEWLHSVWVPL